MSVQMLAHLFLKIYILKAGTVPAWMFPLRFYAVDQLLQDFCRYRVTAAVCVQNAGGNLLPLPESKRDQSMFIFTA